MRDIDAGSSEQIRRRAHQGVGERNRRGDRPAAPTSGGEGKEAEHREEIGRLRPPLLTSTSRATPLTLFAERRPPPGTFEGRTWATPPSTGSSPTRWMRWSSR